MVKKSIKKKKPSKKTSKTTKKKSRSKTPQKIEVDQITLKSRQIFLYGEINEKLAYKINKELIALESLAFEPIIMWINSGGGGVYEAFSIIDTMKGINSPVVTIINGKACSAAGVISICGDKRYATKNSIYMLHDMATGNFDYVDKFLARADHSKELQKKLFQIITDHTKLTPKELEKARHEELWLFMEQAKEKGIIDVIIK